MGGIAQVALVAPHFDSQKHMPQVHSTRKAARFAAYSIYSGAFQRQLPKKQALPASAALADLSRGSDLEEGNLFHNPQVKEQPDR